MSIPLGKGILLVAAPALNDPNFRQTVVLLCEHGPEGALGVIVNRPTAMSISGRFRRCRSWKANRMCCIPAAPCKPIR